jgi:hypothetical protein
MNKEDVESFVKTLVSLSNFAFNMLFKIMLPVIEIEDS